MIGNAPMNVEIGASVGEIVAFNQLYHSKRWSMVACPPTISHYYNFLFPSRVRRAHARMKKRCPASRMALGTIDNITTPRFDCRAEAQRLPCIRTMFHDYKIVDCFRSSGKKPWSLGFYIALMYVHAHQGDNATRVHITGFTHQVWHMHPNSCEKMAIQNLVDTGRLHRWNVPSGVVRSNLSF